MANWTRVTLVVVVLIGGALFFAYWSSNQFNGVLSDLETTLAANVRLVQSSFEKDTQLASTSFETTLTADTLIASSSFEADAKLASASLGISEALATPTDLEPSFNFPEKGDKVYVGCTYPISWQSSSIINSLGAALVDAGARETIDPTASGLAEESVIETNSQDLNWKVGSVWPGEYYIKVSKINDADVEIRSEVFTVNNMPKGTSTSGREKICKESGGSL